MYNNKKYRLLYFLLYPILWIIQIIFSVILHIRHLLYDAKILKSYRFDNIYTICIGNLNLGGTGKTPLTNYLIHLLKPHYKIAVLSRGYGRKTKGFRIVQINDNYTICGDEPLMYKLNHPDAIVAVCEDRVQGIKELQKLYPDIQILILDDAFQHRKIQAHTNILLTTYHCPFPKDQLFPLGNLRDLKNRSQYADIIVISKTPEHIDEKIQEKFLKNFPLTPDKIYFSSIEYDDFYALHYPQTIKPHKELSNYNCILVTGIANPEPLALFIKEYARHFYHLAFPDHHDFSEKDIQLIKSVYQEWQQHHPPAIIITTEKDIMRLKPYTTTYFNLPIFVAPIKISFQNSSNTFNQKILNYVRTNLSNKPLHT